MPPLTTRNARMGHGGSSASESKFRLPSWYSKASSSQSRASISSVCLPETSNCYFPDEEAIPGAKEAFYEKLRLKYECMPCHVSIAAKDIVDPTIVMKWMDRFPDMFHCILHSEISEIHATPLPEKLPRFSKSAAPDATKTNRRRFQANLPSMRKGNFPIRRNLFQDKKSSQESSHSIAPREEEITLPG